MAEDTEKLLGRIEKGWNKIRDLLLGMSWPDVLAAGRERVDMKKVWGWATNEMYELRELVTGMEPEGT